MINLHTVNSLFLGLKRTRSIYFWLPFDDLISRYEWPIFWWPNVQSICCKLFVSRSMENTFNLLLASLCGAAILFLITNVLVAPTNLGQYCNVFQYSLNTPVNSYSFFHSFLIFEYVYKYIVCFAPMETLSVEMNHYWVSQNVPQICTSPA